MTDKKPEEKINDGVYVVEEGKENKLPKEIREQIEEQKKSQEVMEQIQKILDDNDRMIDFSVTFSKKGFEPRIFIVKKPQKTDTPTAVDEKGNKIDVVKEVE